MRKEYILAALFAFICGCNQEGASDVTCTGEDCGCTPECLETEKCIAGTCYDKNECVPACQPGTVCDGGECVADTSCHPECDSDTEKCIDGTCYDKDECVPACKKGEICESGECHLDPTWCEGRICKDNTTYCKDNRWTSCDVGYGCHLGVCIQGLAPECESGMCSENNEACVGGTWVPCGEYDECQAGECVTQEYLCDPGTCSEDNAYRCTEESVYEKCPTGFICKEGMCEEAYDETEMMLWQPCERNSDCGFGVCVFSISTSRPLSSAKYALSEVSVVPVSVLDPRIPEGTGVCSQDCTKDPNVCKELTDQSNGLAEFSCQLVLLGDSEYPPVDENGIEYPLPFHDHLDTSWMEQSPFSAMCRPTEMEHEHYSETFCKSCVESSECSDNESCVMGMCLPHCFTVNSCPATFECVSADPEGELHVCVPNAGTCSTCRDLDGDGQGYGYCTKPGFDCDDLDPDIYYTTDLPKTCVSNITDTNCNGYIDRLELIGSADHCNECEDVCRIDAGAEHFTRTCVQNNGGVLLDDQHMETYKFGCFESCEPGWADCNNDLSDGCEVQLIQTVDDIVMVKDDATMMALDADKDGFGSPNVKQQHYCCASNTDICYGLPYTTQNPLGYWEKVTLTPDQDYVANDTDCDDTRANVNPEAKDVCDGLDNDCNAATHDGHDEALNVYYSKTGFDTKHLGDTCTVRNQSTYSVCDPKGVVVCTGSSDAGFKMACEGTTSSAEVGEDINGKDMSCNNLDDDCDGLIDEHWNYDTCFVGGKESAVNSKDGSINICLLGVKTCSSGNPVCKALYTARAYDFMGDGIDSNCDGYDYDTRNAIFVRNYGDGAVYGKDTNKGTITRPVSGLNAVTSKSGAKGALDIVCTTTDSGTGKTVCHDIIVDSQAGKSNATSEYYSWSKRDIIIPTPNPSILYNANLEESVVSFNKNITQTHKDIITKLSSKDSKGHTSFNLNGTANTLVPAEVYPPKETIRIWGGFSVSCSGSDSCEWTKGSVKSHYALTVAGTNLNPTYTLIQPAGDTYPMSLGLHNLQLELMAGDAGVTGNYNGTTMTGLSCGNYGCSTITLDNTLINVKAPDGPSRESYKQNDNDIYDEQFKWGYKSGNHQNGGYLRDGVPAFGKKNYNAVDAYAKNFDNNYCMYSYQYDGSDYLWKSYDDNACYESGNKLYDASDRYCSGALHRISDHWKRTCPDGNKPHGGCGSIITVNRGSNVVRKYGKDGKGYEAGSGARCSGYSPDEGCDEDSGFSENHGRVSQRASDGKNGVNKKNGEFIEYNSYIYGRGGSTSDVTLSLSRSNNTFRVSSNASNGDGHHGMNGSGGGGGVVYHNYAYKDWSSAVYAGGGGAGGCGGHGGAAGGTGGSAIGMAIVTPDDGSSCEVNVVNESKVSAIGGKGGDGESGQGGVIGGQGGEGYGYAEEGAFDKDTYCMKATSGGSGGNGAGGGGGAGGRAGHAYAFLVVCNTNKLTSANLDNLAKCNIKLSKDFGINPNQFGSVSTKHDGTDGEAGKNATVSAAGSGGTKGSANSESAPVGKALVVNYCNSHKISMFGIKFINCL